MLQIILIVVALAAILYGVWRSYRRYLKSLSAPPAGSTPTSRLTSEALRSLGEPWRVVYEIPAERLGGVDHVAIGPHGVFGIVSVSSPLAPPDSRELAHRASARRALDDQLRLAGLTSAALVAAHWVRDGGDGGSAGDGQQYLPGASLVHWLRARPAVLSPAQIDLAWQTVVTGIGRPDPLA